jgi:hypothetical protein
MRGKMDGQEVNNAAPQIKIEWRVNTKGVRSCVGGKKRRRGLQWTPTIALPKC